MKNYDLNTNKPKTRQNEIQSDPDIANLNKQFRLLKIEVSELKRNYKFIKDN